MKSRREAVVAVAREWQAFLRRFRASVDRVLAARERAVEEDDRERFED
jgi:hypothetical protein